MPPDPAGHGGRRPVSPPGALDDIVHALVAGDADPDTRAAARRHALARAPLLPDGALASLAERVAARVDGLGPLDAVLADPEVTEVLVNAGTDVWVERAGRLARAGITLGPGQADHVLERIVAPLGLRIDRASPIVDARLPDGSRVHAVVPPLAPDGPCISIRRFHPVTLGLDAFAPPPVATLLRWAVAARANVVVSGPTSAGKTTLLGALAAALAPHERVITIEDAAELRLPGDHVVRLEARPPTADGIGGADIRTLVRAALRMRPDRLVVGEVRGAEALDLVQAMSTGHDGSLGTCHANSASDALRRLEAMVLQGGPGLPLPAVRELVHAAVDVVVHVGRGIGGVRQVLAVAEVAPVEALEGDGPRVHRLADEATVVGAPRRARRWPEAGPPPEPTPRAAPPPAASAPPGRSGARAPADATGARRAGGTAGRRPRGAP